MTRKLSTILLIFLAVGVVKLYSLPQWENRDRSNSIDENIDLYQYLPFEANSKIIRLNADSTLKSENNLLNLDDATALYPIYSAFANAVLPPLERNRPGYYPMNGIYVPGQIMCSKTPEAYNRLINGDVDIIFCTAPSNEQVNMAQEKGVTLNLTPIGKEAFVFFVNRNNPIKGINTAGQSPAPAAYGGFPQQSCGVLNPSFPHSLNHARASTGAVSLRSSINNLTYPQICDIYSGRVTNWRNLGGNDIAILAYQRPKNSGSQTKANSVSATLRCRYKPWINI